MYVLQYQKFHKWSHKWQQTAGVWSISRSLLSSRQKHSIFNYLLSLIQKSMSLRDGRRGKRELEVQWGKNTWEITALYSTAHICPTPRKGWWDNRGQQRGSDWTKAQRACIFIFIFPVVALFIMPFLYSSFLFTQFSSPPPPPRTPIPLSLFKSDFKLQILHSLIYGYVFCESLNLYTV